MPTTSGATIGPYKVDREIGRGGMGVVFLAHDTRLGRTVALKALPDDVASDPDRLQRFEREARVLASLNHPNVAAIYGLEESNGRRYLALEHIEGETLADRIARGPLPLQETLNICIEIAAGVEAAHDGGVVHRDLKPANVMITPNDQVKVLDFGLAKGRVATDESGLAKSPALVDSPTLSSPTLSSPTLPHSPTLISPATLPGVILGTAAYLSPEQARGKVVDRRTDIWSFGCILYECLTGKRAFEGETVSDTIAKILERPMDWSTLPRSTPSRLRELLERCLEKDPRRRLRDIGDARLALEEIKTGRYAGVSADAAPATTATQRRRTAIIAAASALAGAIVAIAAWNAFGPPSRASRPQPAHLSIAIPPGIRFETAASALDGRALILLGSTRATRDAEPVTRLYVRRLDRNTLEPIRGTERAQGFIVSPDGRWILFAATPSEQTTQARAFKVPVDGSSPPGPIGDIAASWDGRPAWLESGDFITSVDNGTKYARIPPNGGPLPEAVKFDAPGYSGRLYTEPEVLPGDRGVFLGAIWYEQGVYRQGIGVLDFKSGKAKILIRDGGSPNYSPTGHLLFTRQDALFAVRFDAKRLEVKGEPVAILDGLFQRQNWINARFDAAPNGTLFYAPGGGAARGRRLIIVDRDGKVSDWSGEQQPFEFTIASSPDGSRSTVAITNANAITEIWISDRGRAGLHRLPAKPGADCLGATWSPDGNQIAYYQSSQSADDGLYVADADGNAPPRRVAAGLTRTGFLAPSSWSPDGSMLLAAWVDGNAAYIHTVEIPKIPGTVAEPKPVFHDGVQRGLGEFSRSGRSVAYMSLETGKFEVFVSRWDGKRPVGRPLLVSAGGGFVPHWSANGKRLYYQTTQEKMMAVDIVEEPQLRASAPAEVWDLAELRVARSTSLGAIISVLPDGRLLAVQKAEGEGNPTQVDVVLNFPEELKQRMRAAGK
jgi:serine/threonine-protein kinase